MAQQVKFYSIGANDDKTDANGIYFVTGGELYKGTSRFGANKVTTQATPPTAAQGAISGDINIYNNITKVFDGTEWKNIVDITGLGLSLKASVGDSATTAQHGISAAVSLYSNAEPDLSMTVGAVTTAAGITSTSDYFTTGSAVYNKVIGLSVGGTGSYIEYVDVDGNGKLQAHAKTFPTYTATEVTKSSTSNAHTVSVTTKNGQVTAVAVTAPSRFTVSEIGSATKSSTSGGITASVTTESGKVTSVSLNAENINCSTVTANSGSFTNLTVTSTATFSATTVSATTLTVGGVSVNNISSSTASSTANGITVSVTTENGGVKAVTLDATSFGNVMHFVGVVQSDWTPPSQYNNGDIVVIAGGGWGISGADWVDEGVEDEATVGQEYIYYNGNWELIGDQNTYATATALSGVASRVSAVETSMSTRASVGTGTATASYGVSGQVVLTANAQPTMSIAVVPVTTSAGITSTATTSLATAAAIKAYVDGVVSAATPATSTKGDSDKGIQVSVTTTSGVVTAVDVVTTLDTSLSANANNAPTTKAVYDALCWLDASGAII